MKLRKYARSKWFEEELICEIRIKLGRSPRKKDSILFSIIIPFKKIGRSFSKVFSEPEPGEEGDNLV